MQLVRHLLVCELTMVMVIMTMTMTITTRMMMMMVVVVVVVVVAVVAAPIFVRRSLSPAQLDALHSEATSSGARLRTWRPAPGPWQRLEHC